MEHDLKKLLREEQVMLALTCATVVTGIRRGLNPIQQKDFWSPMGKIAESQEEVFFQDLVHIHRALPPHDTFNPYLAEKGYYTKLKHRVLKEFWDNYDPEQKTQRHIPKVMTAYKKKVSLKPKARRLSRVFYD